MIRVATIDNHEVVRRGVHALLADERDLEVVHSSGTATALLEDAAEGRVEVDVVLLDLALDDGRTTIGDVAGLAERATVLLYTTEQRPVPLREAVGHGASGLLLKRDPVETVVEGIRAAAAGEFYCSGVLAHALLTDARAVAELSARQVEILEALADGLDRRSVTALIGCSDGALKTHLSRVRGKFRAIGVEPRNSHHLTRLAAQQGYLDT